ncbi:hypothetical protein, partial [Klebsiella pneumoniae]|uniref:hypothetical protein n=1 Tax=Klebsiella pneumoniae TaxID=573 RepID=UPI001C6FFBBE
PLTLLPSRSYSNVFSAQILSLKPEVHSTNEDKLCVKVLNKTAFAPFFIALIKFKKKRLVHLAGESARFASRILYDSINVVMPVRLKAL